MTDTRLSDPTASVADRPYKLLIGADLTDAEGGRTRDVVDPSTGQVITQVPEASPGDVAAAVEAARAAQPGWQAMGVLARGDLFRQLAQAVIEREEELALIDAVDSGNPLEAMRLDVRLSLMYLRGWPGLAQALTGQVIDASPGNLHYTRHVPYGVVGRILAFNHPLMFCLTRILPALITGNTVVVKPGVQTPLSALALGEVFREVLPPGVVNVVSGGAETGDAIVTHPVIKRLGFTGSVRTGRIIQERAAQTGVKHVSLELGGKNALIAFPDADPAALAEAAVEGMNMEVCQGQSCGSTSRVFLHRSLHDEVVDLLRQRLGDVVVGPAYAPGTTMGPLVSAEHHERVTSYVGIGKDEGARLVAGGGRPADVPAGGYYLEPTLFTGVDMGMRIAREEIFGPVISVFAWDDYDDVVAQANAVEHGLTASIWTSDLDLAHKTADRLEAGYVWINDTTKHFFGTPFGGMKDSGVGREEDTSELLSYLETKVVHTTLRDPAAALARMTAG